MNKTPRLLVPVPSTPAPVATAVIDDGFIKSRILTIRGVQVLLDSDLAHIYQVETRVFNQAVKRNENRFPPNFRFRLGMEEYKALISQTVTSKAAGEKRGGRQKAPYVFTEQGIAMLSGVLKSEPSLMGDIWCIVVRGEKPAVFVMTPKEVLAGAEKHGDHWWLHPKAYDSDKFRDGWSRIVSFKRNRS